MSRNCVHDYFSCFSWNNSLVIDPKARHRRAYDWDHESMDLGTPGQVGIRYEHCLCTC